MKNKKSRDYLSIRIMVLFTSFALLFNRFMFYPCFRIIKFVFAVFTIIFWYLSLSHRYMDTTTFWTHFNKIPRHLKKFIIGLFNKSFCLSSQKLVPILIIFICLIKASPWVVIRSLNNGTSSVFFTFLSLKTRQRIFQINVLLLSVS
jgi:hypothetical protein